MLAEETGREREWDSKGERAPLLRMLTVRVRSNHSPNSNSS